MSNAQSESASQTCPRCGAKIPAESPQGLCPRCVLGVGVDTQSELNPSGEPSRKETPKRAAPACEDVAKHFPQFDILELIGQGGMGSVYKVRQRELDRLVALKILQPDASRDPNFARRFASEARALARINHSNIVSVHEFGQADGYYYFVMEFVDGLNLRQMLAVHKLAPKEALAIVPQICEALQFAHDQGIVHRDIKPENILLDKQGRVKIADFGLAKLLGTDPQAQRLTAARDVMGTPHYMAPEQIERPLEVDHRADIFSLGVVFYEMLTGELPLGKFAAPSQKVQVDVRLDEVVLKSLEKEPERRYQQASQVKTDVESIAGGAQRSESAPGIAAMNLAESQRRLRVPAWGLAISSLLGPFMLGFLVEIGRLKAGAWMFWPLVIELALTALAAYGALKALRLESYRSAIVGGIAGCVVSFLNFLCLPFAVWLLAVLTRPSVKRAFQLSSADDPCEAFHPHAPAMPSGGSPRGTSESPVPPIRSSRSTGKGRPAFKRWFVPVSATLILLTMLLGACWCAVLLVRNLPYSASQGPSAEDRALLERSAALRLPGNGPEEVVDLSNRLLTEKDWEVLKAKPRLKRLDLRDSSITDADLEHLSSFPELEWLDLSATLGTTPNKPRITGTGLAHFTSLARLRTLILHGNPITDAALDHLKSLPRLERLQLGATRVTGEGLRHLPNLKWLRLDATPITDEGLQHVQAMSGLEQLYLDGTAISDTGLGYLDGLTKLQVLNLHGTKVTAAGIVSLKKKLPAVAAGMDDDLDAQMASATEKTLTSARSVGFWPTREIVFGRRDLLQDCFLSLETGRLLSAPKELTDRLVAQNQWHPGQPVQALAIVDWLRSNRVDLMARTGVDGLTLVDGMGILTAPRPPLVGAPDSADASHVAQASEMLAKTLGVYTNQLPQGLAIHWFDPRGSEKTWIFRNREGRSGLLEILESGGESDRMKIRYRLLSAVLPVEADTKGNQAQFGPVLERVLPFGAPCAEKYFQFHTGNVIAIGDGPGDTSDHAEEYRQADTTGGLDASAIGGKDGIQLAGRGCVFTRNRSPLWDTTTAEQALRTLSRESWLNGVVGIEPKDFPATFLFKTARGECGILQILGVTDDPNGWKELGMKLRYKLIVQVEPDSSRRAN